MATQQSTWDTNISIEIWLAVDTHTHTKRIELKRCYFAVYFTSNHLSPALCWFITTLQNDALDRHWWWWWWFHTYSLTQQFFLFLKNFLRSFFVYEMCFTWIYNFSSHVHIKNSFIPINCMLKIEKCMTLSQDKYHLFKTKTTGFVYAISFQPEMDLIGAWKKEVELLVICGIENFGNVGTM